MRSAHSASGRISLLASVGEFTTLAGLGASLVLFFLGARALVDIGGTCAEGGPFHVARPCPRGIPVVMLAGIAGALGTGALYLWQARRHGAPSAGFLLWMALFLSLGGDLLRRALDPPGGEGVHWGWVTGAAVSLIVGLLPLVGLALDGALRRQRQPYWLLLQIGALGTGAWAGIRVFDIATR